MQIPYNSVDLARLIASGDCRRIRLAARLRLCDMARRTGLSTPVISRIEVHQHCPRRPAAERYYRLLKRLAAELAEAGIDIGATR